MYSGIVEPGETILSLSDQLRITFQSDFFVNYKGFLASFRTGKDVISDYSQLHEFEVNFRSIGKPIGW